MVVAWLAYSAAIQAAIACGESVAAAFDPHRFALLIALHLPLPADRAAEYAQNNTLSTFLRRMTCGADPVAGKVHPAILGKQPQYGIRRCVLIRQHWCRVPAQTLRDRAGLGNDLGQRRIPGHGHRQQPRLMLGIPPRSTAAQPQQAGRFGA